MRERPERSSVDAVHNVVFKSPSAKMHGRGFFYSRMTKAAPYGAAFADCGKFMGVLIVYQLDPCLYYSIGRFKIEIINFYM